jgi:putative transposase
MKKMYQFRIYPNKNQEIVMNGILSTCRHLYNDSLSERFKNFYNGFGYPRFQGKNRYNSFTYPQSGFGLKDGKLFLSKIGNLKIIRHQEIEGKIKTCTIKKDIDHWYVTFLLIPMIGSCLKICG